VAEDFAGWKKSVLIQAVYLIPGPYDRRTIGFWYNAVKTGKCAAQTAWCDSNADSNLGGRGRTLWDRSAVK
jgi:hypothetical protein